jgi:hypothetical protein
LVYLRLLVPCGKKKEIQQKRKLTRLYNQNVLSTFGAERSGLVWCGVVWCGVHIADLKFKKMGYYIDNFYFFYCAHFCPQPLPVF